MQNNASLMRVREQLGFADWSTVRIICPACSQRSPEPHSCPTNEKSDHKKNDDFGAETGEVIVHVLIHGRKGEQEGVFPIRI